MKKFFLVLSLMFVLLSFVKVASAATLTLSPSSGSYTAGQIFTVDVNLDTAGQAIDGLDLYFLRYNSSILEVQDSNSSISGIQIKAGALMAQTLTNTVDPANGKITFSQVTSSGTTYNGSGKLATISFKAIANGTSAVAFDFTLGKTSDTNVAGGGTDKLTSVSNASFSVTGGSDPLPPPPASSSPGGSSSSTPIVYIPPITGTGGSSLTTISGCDNRTTGFSRTSGLSCAGNINNVATKKIYNLGIVTLRNGSRGEAVKELQRLLNKLLNLGLKEDGKLGPKTILVIKKWQNDHKLKADGLVGPKTKMAMKAEGEK